MARNLAPWLAFALVSLLVPGVSGCRALPGAAPRPGAVIELAPGQVLELSGLTRGEGDLWTLRHLAYRSRDDALQAREVELWWEFDEDGDGNAERQERVLSAQASTRQHAYAYESHDVSLGPSRDRPQLRIVIRARDGSTASELRVAIPGP